MRSHRLPVVACLLLAVAGCARCDRLQGAARDGFRWPPGPPVRAGEPVSIERALELRTAEPDQAIAILRRVRHEALGNEDAATAARALHRAGDLFHDAGWDDDAEAAYRRALAEHEQTGDRELQGLAANDLGLLFQDREQYEEAARWYGEAVEVRRGTANRRGLQLSLNNLGAALFYAMRVDESERAYLEAAALARELGDAAAERRVQANRALLWSVVAEGGCGLQDPESTSGGTPPPVAADAPAEVRAREAYRAALEAAARAGEPPTVVCDQLGQCASRCERLAPREPGR